MFDETPHLHKRESLTYHKCFSILVFERSFKIEIALVLNRNGIIMISKVYHYEINLVIASNFYISIDSVYPGSLAKDLL